MVVNTLGSALLILAASIGAAEAQSAGASATMLDVKGAEIGKATVTPSKAGVLISVEINGLPPGEWVALHVHENGACDAADGFESAGAHFNPRSAEHGYHAANGPHAGDMPNQFVNVDGTLRVEVFNGAMTLGDGDTNIADRSLVIHAGVDDYETQPAGGAGDRIACGVIGTGTP